MNNRGGKMSNNEIIKQYLESLNDPKINEALNDGKHTLDKCWTYITSQARKELNGRSGAVEDAKVFKWVRDYYYDDVKKDEVEEIKPKKENKKKIKVEEERKQMSIFDFM